MLETTKLKLKLVRDYGRSSEVHEVQCQEQRGKFYVSMQTLNASHIGIGLSPAEAAADYAKKCGATSHLLIVDRPMEMHQHPEAPEAQARPRG